VVYVDDIVITGDNARRVIELKQYFSVSGHKTLDSRYFLDIEVARSKKEIFCPRENVCLIYCLGLIC